VPTHFTHPSIPSIPTIINQTTFNILQFLTIPLTHPPGIGLATAHHLLSHSHKLVLISRTHSALDELHYQYGSERVEVLAGDMADPSLASKAVNLALERWGRLDGLVINHGSLEPVKKIADGSVEEWKRAFEGNVFSAVGLVSCITS
jgi:NADP-dependent 3-hydroxy acid dehydrogenase YdfG